MSVQMIAFSAIGVFVLMCIGIIMTMIEFNNLTDDPSVRKGSDMASDAMQPPRGKAEMRIVHSNEKAA